MPINLDTYTGPLLFYNKNFTRYSWIKGGMIANISHLM